MRDFLPKGLYWRSLLIIVVPAALLQLIVTIIFLDDHWRATSKRMSQGVAGDIAFLITLYERDPRPDTFADLEDLARNRLLLNIALEPNAPIDKPRCAPLRSVADRYLRAALRDHLGRELWFDASCPGDRVEIRAPIAGGTLRVMAYRDRVEARSGPLFVVWIVSATVLLCVVSVLFIRNQVRPIETLSTAMIQFGRGADPGLFKARGAREVRAATHAFFEMRARIKRHIDQRAQLLAGVSHDLRTPLTRLKLAFAMMAPTPELEDARRDLVDMEATLDDYLAFARGQFGGEAESADLAALAREAGEDAKRGGAAIQFEGLEATPLIMRAQAVRRALVNLIDNAASHAQTVIVRLVRQNGHVVVEVDDDGPGIPEHLYEDAFRPFSRLDATRTKNAKGVGLGLAIARDVARSHGGDVKLSRSPMGGLRASFRLPAPVG